MIYQDLEAEKERRRQAGLMAFRVWDIRERIKAVGGLWDDTFRAWLLPSGVVARSLGLVQRRGRFGLYWTKKGP